MPTPRGPPRALAKANECSNEETMVKKTILSLLLLAGWVLAGCQQQTLTRDEPQQNEKYSRIADLNRRMFAEDIDAILLLDQPSDLTRWHIPR